MQKLDSFYMDRADHGIPMPGAAERAIMNQGTVAGTFWGEIARMMMQFKSFPITMIRRGLGREIYGQANGKADIMGLAQLMVATTVMGYSQRSILRSIKNIFGKQWWRKRQARCATRYGIRT